MEKTPHCYKCSNLTNKRCSRCGKYVCYTHSTRIPFSEVVHCEECEEELDKRPWKWEGENDAE